MNIIGISGLDNSILFKKKEFPHLSSREYRITQGLDSAAALVDSEGVKAAAAEERFTGDKGTCAFPVNAIRYCLESANVTPDAIDYIAHNFSYEPYRSLFDLNEFSRKQFAEVYSLEAQLRCLQEYFPAYNWADKLIRVPHHLAHAASTFYLSGFEEALILIVDAMGEIHSTTIAIGRKNDIEIIKQIPAFHSLGVLYGLFTLYLGFYMAFDEYKVMGLAPYGNPNHYIHKLTELIQLKEEGTYAIPFLFKNNSVEEKETYSGTLRILTELFGPPREPGSTITQRHMDIAASLQVALQMSLMHILRHFKKETGQSKLCMAGGVALNCTANAVIKRSHLFKDMFIQPAAGDDGSALGAALYVQRLHEQQRPAKKMGSPLWGPDFDPETIRQVLRSRKGYESTFFAAFEDLARETVRRIKQGQVVAWFQGRMEFGPRALGNRSILADPRDPGMRDHINSLIKQREEFRPFAPAVTIESAPHIFEIDEGEESLYAYMLLVTQVRPAFRERLPAVTHVDGSARVQVVTKEDNARFWALLNEFEKVSGMAVLLNTSFNLRGQPIICTPGEAIDTFLASELDVLVLGDYVITRQPTLPLREEIF